MLEASAALLRLEFLLGHATTNDVITWADNTMVTVENPSNELMDLSMAANESPTTIASLLSKISGETVNVAVAESAFRMFVAKMWGRLEGKLVTAEAAVKELYAAGLRSNLTLPHDITASCGSLNDEFDLVQQGKKDRDAAEKALAAFLVKVKAPGL